MVQKIDRILLPTGLTMTSNEENVFSSARSSVIKNLPSGSQQRRTRKSVKSTPVTQTYVEASPGTQTYVAASPVSNCLTVGNAGGGGAPESGTFLKPSLPFNRTPVSVQKANNTQTLSLGVEVISYNPPSEDIKKFLFNCRLCGKVVGNIFDIDQHNIDQGHFKCMFKDCNGMKFPSQFELFAHQEAKHKILQRPVPVNSESLASNLLPQQLVLATQSPQRSSAALPQNQSFPVPRSGYSNKSKHVEGGAGSRTDQTSSTGEEVVVLDDSDEMDYNVATPAEQVSSRLVNVNGLAASPVANYTNSRFMSPQQPSNSIGSPAASSPGNSVPRRGRGSRNQAAGARRSLSRVFAQQELGQESSNVAATSTPRSNVTPIVDRPPRLPTVDLTREVPLQSPRAVQGTPRKQSGQTPASSSSFTCNICHKSLATQHFLNLHMKTAHRSPNKPFRCPNCSTNYSTHEALIEHLKLFHSVAPESRAMCIPVVDLNKPGTREQLRQLGIDHFIPLSNPSADSNGNYCVPLYVLRENAEGVRTEIISTKEVLKLGPLKTLPF